MAGDETTARPERIHPACPSAAFPFQLGGKWMGMVILCLADRPRRFTELREAMGGVTAKVLSQTLRDMVRDGLAVRLDFEENPPRVEYELTALGSSLIEVIDAVRAWSERHLDELLRARESSTTAV
ncbi:winged helix-turn-helix transcriptional regulator [Arthrobacter sp. NPDC090010]|uniref:winged helix-turn-helix transcriptional regulator n=1 Tax=Arthrobacter sp. NPDC090010 TaxID=3363942 RepID=UPI00382154AA